MTVAAWLVVVGSVVVVIAIGVVLARQRDPGRLSEHGGGRPGRDAVVERPAGPDAEAMAAESGPVLPPPPPHDDEVR